MLLEEPDHRGRPLQRGHVAGELGAEIGARAGLGRGGRENENEGAQARYQGFQGTTSASETGQRRAPQSGSTRRARRGRLCQIRRGYRRAQWLPRSLTKPSQGLLQAFSRRTTRNAPRGAFRRLRDRDSNPNFRTRPHGCRPFPPVPRCRTDARFCLRRVPVCSRPYLRQTCDKAIVAEICRRRRGEGKFRRGAPDQEPNSLCFRASNSSDVVRPSSRRAASSKRLA